MIARRGIVFTWVLVVLAFSVETVAGIPVETIDVGNLHVEHYGTRGSPIILIPGLACGSWVWTETIAQLQSNHQLYAITLAGFDGRPAGGGEGFDSMVSSLRELIESKHILQPILVGHSMGGTLAMLYAERYSDSIHGVVAVDGLPVFPGTENLAEPERRSLADRVRSQLTTGTQQQFQDQQLVYMQTIGVMSGEKARLLAARSSRSDPVATANFAAADMMLDLRANLHNIKVPVLEIVPYDAAEQAALGFDENGKVTYYRSLLNGVANLTLAPISPSRHFVMVDQPEAFLIVLNQFLGN